MQTRIKKEVKAKKICKKYPEYRKKSLTLRPNKHGRTRQRHSLPAHRTDAGCIAALRIFS